MNKENFWARYPELGLTLKITGALFIPVALILCGQQLVGNFSTSPAPAVVAPAEAVSEQPKVEPQQEATIDMNNPKNRLHAAFANEPGVIKDINEMKLENGDWVVMVDTFARDSFTKDMIVKGIENDMAKIHRVLFRDNPGYDEVIIYAWMPSQDKYGQKDETDVYFSKLTGSEAAKINWNLDDYTLEHQIIPGVWESRITSPWLRGE